MWNDGNRSSLAVIFACEFWQQYSKDNVALQQWVYSAMRSEYSTLWSCCHTFKCGGRKKGTGIYILLRTLNRFLHSCVPERFEDRFLIEIRASELVLNLSVKHNKVFHFPWIAGKTPTYFLFLNYFSSPVVFFSSFMCRMGSTDNWLLPANWCISIGNHAAAQSNANCHCQKQTLFSHLDFHRLETRTDCVIHSFLKRWGLSTTYLPELLIRNRKKG